MVTERNLCQFLTAGQAYGACSWENKQNTAMKKWLYYDMSTGKMSEISIKIFFLNPKFIQVINVDVAKRSIYSN